MEFTTHITDIPNSELIVDNVYISDEDELSDDSLTESYNTLYLKWIE